MPELPPAVRGFGVTFKTMFKKVVTEQYPEHYIAYTTVAVRTHDHHIKTRLTGRPDKLPRRLSIKQHELNRQVPVFHLTRQRLQIRLIFYAMQTAALIPHHHGTRGVHYVYQCYSGLMNPRLGHSCRYHSSIP